MSLRIIDGTPTAISRFLRELEELEEKDKKGYLDLQLRFLENMKKNNISIEKMIKIIKRRKSKEKNK